jgi:hypothetical protein
MDGVGSGWPGRWWVGGQVREDGHVSDEVSDGAALATVDADGAASLPLG